MRSAGIAIILIGITALWLYNTGRLEAVLKVVQNPAFQPGKTQQVTGLGLVNPAGIGTPPIVGNGDIFGTIANIFKGVLTVDPGIIPADGGIFG